MTRLASGAVDVLRRMRGLRRRREAGTISEEDYQAELEALASIDDVNPPSPETPAGERTSQTASRDS